MSNQIKSFTRPLVKDLREAIITVLNTVESQYGITFTFNNIRFSDNSFSTKLEARVGTNSNEHAKAEWKQNSWAFGLSEHDFGKTFIHNDAGYTIVGIKPRSPKFPVIAMNHMDGKKYKMPVDLIKNALRD